MISRQLFQVHHHAELTSLLNRSLSLTIKFRLNISLYGTCCTSPGRPWWCWRCPPRRSPRSWRGRAPPSRPCGPCTSPARPRPPASQTPRLKHKMVVVFVVDVCQCFAPFSTHQFWRWARPARLPRSRRAPWRARRAPRCRWARRARHCPTPRTRRRRGWRPWLRCWKQEDIRIKLAACCGQCRHSGVQQILRPVKSSDRGLWPCSGSAGSS